MSKAKLFSAFTAGAISLGTALMALLTDAQSFADISSPAYAVAVIGGLVTVLKDVQSSNRDPGA